MKNIILKIFAILLITVGLSGCYTIVWTPKDNFPTAENSDYQDNGYYASPYYGGYNYYYNYPWWYSIQPPTQTYIRDSNRGQETLRNGISGRSQPERNGVLTPNLPTTGSSSVSTGSSSTNKGNSGDRVESTGTNNNSRPASTGSNNTLRNNDGGRNNNNSRNNNGGR